MRSRFEEVMKLEKYREKELNLHEARIEESTSLSLSKISQNQPQKKISQDFIHFNNLMNKIADKNTLTRNPTQHWESREEIITLEIYSKSYVYKKKIEKLNEYFKSRGFRCNRDNYYTIFEKAIGTRIHKNSIKSHLTKTGRLNAYQNSFDRIATRYTDAATDLGRSSLMKREIEEPEKYLDPLSILRHLPQPIQRRTVEQREKHLEESSFSVSKYCFDIDEYIDTPDCQEDFCDIIDRIFFSFI